MAKIKLAEYLFQQIKAAGVDYTFGIPGDFVLPHYAAQERVGLNTAVLAHEPGVGYAADAYARIKGLGVALVTYGAGGLNMVNPTALAYAEESPLLVISGGPETRFRSQKPQLHHCVKTFDTQLRVYNEVTEASTILENPATAQQEIDRVLESTRKLSRPGYLEIPRDLVNQEIDLVERAPSSIEGESKALKEAVSEIFERLQKAKQPVLMVGVQTKRQRLTDKVIKFAEAFNLPVVTSILGKATFPETHPNFIGTYFGQFGNPNVKEFVEASDCIVCLGAVLTEMETGGYTAKLETEKLVHATTSEVNIGHRSYPGVDLATMLQELVKGTGYTGNRAIPKIAPEELSEGKQGELTVAGMINNLNQMLDQSYSVISDVGDCLYAGLSLKTDCFIAPGYYSSMGFGVPAGIGAQLADKTRRPIILVGDGGFQMTGMEMSTAVKMGLNPIIIVFNNASYGMLRFIDQQRDYYRLPRWDYAALAKAVGGKGVQASTKADFQSALQAAKQSKELFLIDAVISEDDISPTLKRLTDHFGKKVKASIS